MRVAVVGAGILGVMTALLAARRGWEVEMLEAQPTLWSGSSRANEGKIHLGLIFALGDVRTHDVMLRGALRFSSLVEEAVGSTLPWPDLVTDPFDYLVMPDSLLNVRELSVCYDAQNRHFDELRQEVGSRYLGADLPTLVDSTPGRHEPSGLPAFATRERAVDPIALGRIMTAAIAAQANIRVRTNTRVVDLTPVGDEVAVTCVSASSREPARDIRRTDRVRFVVNCAWDQQMSLMPALYQAVRNFRVKVAVRLPPVAGARPLTLVQGPFGDVVPHHDYTYASWYPTGRLSNEQGRKPSASAYRLLAAATTGAELANVQLEALHALGVLPDTAADGALIGGVIIGHGERDIDTLDSGLHSRGEFDTARVGNIVAPSNFKFTTAPLAALRAVEAIERAAGATGAS